MADVPTTKYFKLSVKPFQRLGGVRGGSPEKTLKKKRKINGNPTRRPPARLIANYKVFKVSVKPFQRLGGARGGSPEKPLKKKRKVNGNPTRRPPARLIAILQSILKFRSSLFKGLRGSGRSPREKACGV